MWGWVKALFSDTDTLEKTVDKGLEIIDESSFTKEEKAVARLKLLDSMSEFLVKLKFMSRARRVLAFMIVAEYMLLINVSVIALAFGASAFADIIFSDVLLGRMQMLVNIVVGFYFFTGVLKNK